jgi:hypothetical protein
VRRRSPHAKKSSMTSITHGIYFGRCRAGGAACAGCSGCASCAGQDGCTSSADHDGSTGCAGHDSIILLVRAGPPSSSLRGGALQVGGSSDVCSSSKNPSSIRSSRGGALGRGLMSASRARGAARAEGAGFRGVQRDLGGGGAIGVGGGAVSEAQRPGGSWGWDLPSPTMSRRGGRLVASSSGILASASASASAMWSNDCAFEFAISFAHTSC